MKIIMTRGAPASGKSLWAREFVSKDPLNWMRVNNDELRAMCNGTTYDKGYEKLIASIRSSIIKEALLSNRNVIIDNVNCGKQFADTMKLCYSIAGTFEISEKCFYEELPILLERNSKRDGAARVADKVVEDFWRFLGGKSFKNYIPKTALVENEIKYHGPKKQDASLPKCAVFDNDGTISLLNGRNPYDATHCDNDLPHEHVIECLNLYASAGYKIFFVSGRKEKDRAPTERFYQKHFPHIKYELFMRPTGSNEKDVNIKEKIYKERIENKYYVSAWFDDRLQICKWLYSEGLPLFRVNDPEACF